MSWNIEKIDPNHYLATKDGFFFEFLLSTKWENNPEILFGKSHDMSKDSVIFYPSVYPTPEEDHDSAIVGEAYLYNELECIDQDLVTASILRTNIPEKAKNQLEMLCV